MSMFWHVLRLLLGTADFELFCLRLFRVRVGTIYVWIHWEVCRGENVSDLE